MPPTILITRPAAQGQAFAKALESAYGGALPVLLAPLMEIVPVVPVMPIGAVDHLIFTSANAVSQSAALGLPKTATAWCVGDKTGDAARAAGYTTKVAGGDGDALVDLLIREHPEGRLVHLHGAHVAGALVAELRDAGLWCEGVVVYDQPILPPSEQLLGALRGSAPLVVPLFSPRSARLLAETGEICAPLTLISISAAAAEAANSIPNQRMIVADSLGRAALIDATLAAFRAILPPKMP